MSLSIYHLSPGNSITLFPRYAKPRRICMGHSPQIRRGCVLIERYFGTIERRWISKLPGWYRCSIAECPTDFQKTLSKLLQKEELLTLEEFVDYFQNTILPEYRGSPDTETSIPELPGWDLTFDSMSPIQRYENLEKARTITPDWNTISTLKLQYSANHVVSRWGIRFKISIIRPMSWRASLKAEWRFYITKSSHLMRRHLSLPYATIAFSVRLFLRKPGI